MNATDHTSQIIEFATEMCLAPDYRSLLASAVRQICRFQEAENLYLWVRNEANELVCEASRDTTLSHALATEVNPTAAEILEEVLKHGSHLTLGGAEATRRLMIIDGEVVRSSIFVPLADRTRAFGVIQAINKSSGVFTRDDLDLLEQLGGLVASVIGPWRDRAETWEGMLRAITRLTLLYDISQSFNSTIQMDELAPIICNRTAKVMEAESCSLWLVNRDQMTCRAVQGDYRRELIGHNETNAGTVVGEMLRDNATLVINDPNDRRLATRLPHMTSGAVTSLICAPIQHEGKWLGALEIINRHDGHTFSGSDSVLIDEVAMHAANSIRNAQRHEAERRVKELQALLRSSHEITSSLNLDRLLAVVVNEAATLIPFDRCAIALQSKGRYTISAIAGEAEVKLKDPKVKEWGEVIDWAGQTGAEVYVSEHDGKITSDRAETREKFLAHFKASGMRSFYSLPLADEEGPLGVLTLESKTPRFLSAAHLELLKIFAGLATVAIRNAQLYKQVPLIGALEPLAAKKRAFLAMPKAKRALASAAVALILLFLLFFPLNLKIGGSGYVLPTHSVPVTLGVDGVIERVNYREGDVVPAGAVIATLRSDEHRLNLDQARAEHDIIAREILRVQAGTGAAAAQIERVKLDQADRQIALLEEKLEQTQVRAPIGGVIVTPQLEQKRGRFIRRGEVFCETADTDAVVVEAAVPEDDIGLIEAGQEVWLKANGFPERTFVGRVARISPQATVEQGTRVFVVHAEISNPDQLLRTGMVGRVKILTGSRSAGYVLLREPARWLRKKVWSWIP